MASTVNRFTLPTIALSLMTVISAVSGLNVAIPSMAVDTGATQSEITWIVDSYTVVFAGLLLLAGALGDRFGRRNILALGLVFFAIAAGAGSFMSDPVSLIGVRILMVIGAAAIMPATLSIITSSFPPEKRAQAVSVWVGVAGAGAVLGLFASAFLLEYFEWNSFFLLNVGLAITALIGTLFAVPDSRASTQEPLDIVGGLLSVVGVASVVFGIIEGSDVGWDDTRTISALTLGALAISSFVLWELRIKHPLLDPRLFKLAGFTSGTVSLTIQFFAQFGFFFVGMQYLQYVADFTPLRAATQLLWLPLIVFPGARISAMLSRRISQKILGGFGLSALATGVFLFANLGTEFDYWYFTTALLIFGLGFAFSMTPATVAITESLSSDKQGVASAMNDLSREVGSAIGIAVLGAALNDTYRSEMEQPTANLPAEVAEQIQSNVAFVTVDPPAPLAMMWDDLVTAGIDAFTLGVGNAMGIAGWVAAAGAVIVIVVAPWKKLRGEPAVKAKH